MAASADQLVEDKGRPPVRLPNPPPARASTGYGDRKHWKVVRRRAERLQGLQYPLRKCPESWKLTGRLEPPARRVRCLFCGRLVWMRVGGYGHVVIQLHYMPAPSS